MELCSVKVLIVALVQALVDLFQTLDALVCVHAGLIGTATGWIKV